MTASDGGAGAMRRDENDTAIGNAFVAASRGAQPERTNVTASDDTRADEDAAAVIAVIAALAAQRSDSGMALPSPRSVWAASAARRPAPGPHTWWASGLPA